eukprot:TRINITY_DN3384_c0_g2_i21.p1 TRINITY_DN3384_c0_g2~~TRINITY_DN3384_c0_g2_i21.p1  ORF type:complete len:100 (+),score=15.95 TRINITY_DN3384_c0_g2_i21:808-1107(+)
MVEGREGYLSPVGRSLSGIYLQPRPLPYLKPNHHLDPHLNQPETQLVTQPSTATLQSATPTVTPVNHDLQITTLPITIPTLTTPTTAKQWLGHQGRSLY